jgi:hypothetical protein
MKNLYVIGSTMLLTLILPNNIFGQTKKEAELAKMDSIFNAASQDMSGEQAAIAQAIADSTAYYTVLEASDSYIGYFTYKNTSSFTGYVLIVAPPNNSYSDYSFTLEVADPDKKYSIEGFAVKKGETVEYYYSKTKSGIFPLASTINKKLPLFSLKKVNDLVLTIWGQIKEDENISVLFKK